MANIKLCKTKAGKGFKVVVDDQWFYTSKYEMYRLLNDDTSVCNFRTIDDNENNGGQPEERAGPHIEVLDDEDDFDYEEKGWTKKPHAYQDYLLEHESGAPQ